MSPPLSPAIGKLGYRMAMLKQFVDPLRLDANYVRRSDAEASWIDRQERASTPRDNRSLYSKNSATGAAKRSNATS